MNARNLETLIKVHASFWIYFSIINFKPVRKAFLTSSLSIVLQEINWDDESTPGSDAK